MSSSGEERRDELTQLLSRWVSGDQEALKSLLPLVYAELRRLAHYRLRGERPNHSIETTSLVHEAYLRLAQRRTPAINDRNHFFALAAGIMRQVLVDHAREKQAKKRAGCIKLELQPEMMAIPARNLDLLALDAALTRLANLDARQCRIVELRFFAGLSIEDTSDVLGLSPATVKRDWITARVWLQHEISKRSKQARAAGISSVS
ncbi:MAG TPA: ECF-type sigma factor [Terriglobales bacterium]|nr:ECF-type sigma factor [Terriglobales bacterium]